MAPIVWETSRLIPAHAGKTYLQRLQRSDEGAHPRSRGENQDENIINLTKQGSSPLTRGKLTISGRREVQGGLIPAHAGKTPDDDAIGNERGAHPRSRGENTWASRARGLEVGSSPLTRGKRTRGIAPESSPGLIPAHAGKT